MIKPRNTGILVCLALAGTAACRDATGPGAAEPVEPERGGAALLHTVPCDVTVATAQVVCRAEGAGTPGGGPSRAILGLNQIKLASSNVVYDSVAETFSFDVTMQNLLAEPVGTPDGVVKVGSKVFHDTGPTVTAYNQAGDTGTVTVANADGTGHFTRAAQPYHLYDTILAPQAISAPKRWVLNVPREVKTFQLMMKVFTPIPSEPRVPSAAPDGVPDWVYAPANISTNLPQLSGTYLRQFVTVMFAPGTPQDERQAAVNAVGGTVVGGRRLPEGDGMYYVQLADDGTAAPLVKAMDRLEGLPQVIGASAEMFQPAEEALAYIAPVDGPDYQSWRPRAALADSANWALEAIHAPAAWGCTTGSPATRVAVLDRGFHMNTATDVAVNERSRLYEFNNFPQSMAHGTMVSSLIGARGTNGQGVAGVMWHAGLDLVAVGTDSLGVPTMNAAGQYVIRNAPERLGIAISGGAPIINVSLGLRQDSAKIVNPTLLATKANQAMVQSVYRQYRAYMKFYDMLGKRPLVVVAAGNDAIDASWSAIPMLVNDFPDRVLVVAAAQLGPGGALQPAVFKYPRGTNGGTLVEITAPGKDVGVLDGAGALTTADGTSLAAPLVTGVAGLLLSFDPRLTAAQLKTLLLGGAQRGGRLVANQQAPDEPLPVLDAYQSLAMAAGTPGTPLCGNRVWISYSGTVYAERGRGPGLITEPLFSVTPGSYWLGGMHQSHLRLFENGQEYDAVFRFGASGWQMVPESDPAWDSLYWESGPVLNSQYGYSHGGDSTLVTSNAGGMRVSLRDNPTGNQRWIGTVPIALGESENRAWQCTRMYTTPSNPAGACADSSRIGTTTQTYPFASAYSPRGDTAVVAVYTSTHSWRLESDWYPCPQQDPQAMLSQAYHCRDVSYSVPPSTSRVYVVSPAGWRQLTAPPGRVDQLSMSDGLTSDVYARATSESTLYYQWWVADTTSIQNGYATRWKSEGDPERSSYTETCSSRFYDLSDDGAVSLLQCLDNGGTFAPSRQPALRSMPASAPPAPRPAPPRRQARGSGSGRHRH
ncbi:MAG TPA: S8 family serine peptidase [Longimicrobium sp.]|nr:S8 family serine peptidase [Longimicrobium sp.]